MSGNALGSKKTRNNQFVTLIIDIVSEKKMSDEIFENELVRST